MKTLFAVFLCLLCGVVSAAEHDLYFDVNLTSKHLYTDKTTDLNQRNFGLGITYDLSNTNAVKIGFYKNSFERLSTYALFDHTKQFLSKNIRVGIAGGLVTGYAHTNGQYAQIYNNVQLIVLPHVDFNIGKFSMVLGALPKLLTVQIQYKVRGR